MRYTLTALSLLSAFALPLAGCGGGSAGSTLPILTPTPAPAATPIPSRSFRLAVSGTRGTVPVSLSGSVQVLSLGSARPVASPVAGSHLLSAPPTYGDRAFLGWEHAGVRFSSAPVLTALPESLGDGDTITAVFGPLSSPTAPLTPSYNQPDHAVWPTDKLPLKVYFDSSLTSQQQALITQGLERWVQALGGAISYTQVGSEAEASIVIKTGPVASGAAETVTTGLNMPSPIQLVKAVITLDFTQIPPLESDANRSLLVALASHELGHALGINGGGVQGHSPESTDTMFPTISASTQGITPRDINTLQNIYASLLGLPSPQTVTRATTAKADATATFTQTVPCHVHLDRLN